MNNTPNMADGGSLQREIYSREESQKDNTKDGTNVIGNSTDTMNGDADDATALDPGSDIRLEDVESMDLGDVFDFLEAREVPCPDVVDLKEMHDLVRRTLRQEADNAPSCPAAGADDGRDGHLAEALTKDTVMKQELAEIYDRVIPFIRTGLNADLRDPLIKLYGTNFEARLEQNRRELVNGDCPIVVAGETSAGKSSLLNLLLGTDILPHSLLSSTSTICCLHNIRSTDRRRFVVYPEGGGASVCHNIEEGREKEALEKLKVAVSENRSNPGDYCSQVDIYWPIPLLGENTQVTIVDTPGVGESGNMTSRLFRYLPNAIAFIYVLNSANAGGIQEDKLIEIVREQQRDAKRGGMSGFDPACTMFVCNKWDIVEDREGRQPGTENKVWEDTLDKLEKYFPNYNRNHVYKMYTTQARRYQANKMGRTEKLKRLMEGFEQLVPASLLGKITKHYRWLDKLLERLQSFVATRINRARDSDEEKQRLHDTVTKRLNTLSMDAGKVKDSLMKRAREACEDMSRLLHGHLNTPEVQDQLKHWTDLEAPSLEADDFEATRFKGDNAIMERIRGKIRDWGHETGHVRHALEDLTRRFREKCRLLSEETKKLEVIIEGDPLGDDVAFPLGRKSVAVEDTQLFSKSEKIILVVAAPLWVPIVTAASLLFLPVGVGMLIRESIKVKSQRVAYEADKAGSMRKWTELIMSAMFTRENIKEFIFETYFNMFEMKINELCDKKIPDLIAADREQVRNIQKDRRTAKEILDDFKPVQEKLMTILGHLRLYELRHVATDVIDVTQLRREREAGSGNFSTVYKARLELPGEGGSRVVALKVLKRRLDGEEMYTQLTEVESLRRLKHENIVELMGVCYSDLLPPFGAQGEPEPQSAPKLMMVLEHCDTSLETLVFDNEDLKCGSQSDNRRKDALAFYQRTAAGICEGLTYIHDKKYAHRDLKLSNVLMKGHIAKLCDLGFARQEVDITGTFVGTMSHMSPEMLSNKRYTYKTDIYSLGILLWELWYGRYVYSEDEYRTIHWTVLIDAIKAGTRPRCDKKYAMVDSLREIVEKCWDNDPTIRPEARDVAVIINAL
ncbi:dual serine/threonine and tyrosine protein kinase-like isoform X1 [Mya arenaria]|uniref:dual serine/threonine and tyrosine protein kinase-like isoform X1 n=2 Tax=Mya arenaria TaxID=6604 RepID=UPI0022E21969|nr:dual serine/threonine and tyrosine protein kinase-like isoform X1 [Mya arenaria]